MFYDLIFIIAGIERTFTIVPRNEPPVIIFIHIDRAVICIVIFIVLVIIASITVYWHFFPLSATIQDAFSHEILSDFCNALTPVKGAGLPADSTGDFRFNVRKHRPFFRRL